MPVVITKAAGRSKELLPNWHLPLPPEFSHGGEGGVTLRELLSRIVRTEAEAFKSRQKAQRYLTVLSEEDIREAARKGKVTSGQSDVVLQDFDAEVAIGAALQAFEDGMYLVFLDDVEQRELDREVYLTEDSTITFLRLTFLAGG